ncbi:MULTISPECIES: WXG100 family type VII secretion target [Streptomyces]|uniref:ESAT-6-like protein n=2 Tax=Streptomyces TaxID=1883 RepID=A0A6G3T3L7_STRAQ|nr:MULTISPECIES: WXG100 family type VII secretion target [Streptomyces]NDZ59801.1 WXG100 family type VII secretion target [Streptomyces anulatus]NEB89857.1 WXG100 family type VII secretion target [Streptomyces anulatus]NEC02823.1 WXG100 family type VII secretion target [Streptomyces anulatus]NED26379.1 WXG100 family type VII secretion target [Streptomyces anulatus]OLO34646.1 WXG100 family type VII secretion target [Streptomyces sp. MNU77]
MADGIIDVQYSTVRNAIEELTQQTKQIITTLNNLEDELKPLIASWEGDDQAMYRGVQAEWDQATKNMALLLGDSGELVQSIHDNHSRDERRSADNWGGVRAR